MYREIELWRLTERNSTAFLAETESQQVSRYTNGLRSSIMDRISLVPVYTLDEAYNLATRVEAQISKNSRSWANNRTTALTNTIPTLQASQSTENSLSHVKEPAPDKGKTVATSSAVKPSNPYARPLAGKCFKCGIYHRPSFQ